MRGDELQEAFELYALGVLEGDERAQVEALLASDPERYRPILQEALAKVAIMGTLAEDAQPPARLRKRLLAAAGAPERSQPWLWAWAMAATAALLIGVFFVLNQRSDFERQLAEAREQLRQSELRLDRVQTALRFLDQPGTRAVGFGEGQPAPPRGNFFVNPQGGVLLIASNLPPLETGRTYQMWLIPKGQNPVPGGLFRADETGIAVHLQPGPVDPASLGAVAVSVEPESGSLQPTTTPIIVAAVAGL
jgi:anti-sigma-K factor RskA